MAKSRRVAIVGGVRTPFAKRDTSLASLSALDLGALVTAEVLQRAGLAPSRVERVVFGQVLATAGLHNVAREIVLAAGLRPTIEAFTVSRACTSGHQAIASVAEAILAGTIDCGVAGGTESFSTAPLLLPRSAARGLERARAARTGPGRVAALASLRAEDLVTVGPSFVERSTGQSLGESAEGLAETFGISRVEQDRLAHRSHERAHAAWTDGRLAREVMPLYVPPALTELHTDGLVRPDSALATYARLRPAFTRNGTVTAGNSAPVADGAAALLLMNEDLARAEGLEVLATLRSHAFIGVDPHQELLLGAVHAIRLVLERATARFQDLALVDLHEAFAAQVLATTRALESGTYARERLGREHALGSVDWDRCNVTGGALALGHPFSATGIRQVLQTTNELRRRGGELALVAACAAGGLGGAFVLEVA